MKLNHKYEVIKQRGPFVILYYLFLDIFALCSVRWYTVTKVHTGHDEATLDRLQKELGPNMVKIKQDYDKVPVC